jgi:hypothetical protein
MGKARGIQASKSRLDQSVAYALSVIGDCGFGSADLAFTRHAPPQPIPHLRRCFLDDANRAEEVREGCSMESVDSFCSS